MRYLALCCDYDGTLAHDGTVSATTRAALERCVASGRRLLLVTGRELPELKQVCNCLELFACVVAENGALLYHPDTGEERVLASPVSERFVRQLRERGVAPLSTGRVIVATWEPHQATVLDTIKDLGLELQVIFNKGAVMVLPAGVNKASGLAQALEALGLSAHNAVAVGDAENDQAFLRACECGVAVANALPSLKDTADFVTRATHGDGVQELIDELVASDLAARESRLARHHVLLGHDIHGEPVSMSPYDTHLLLLDASGSGKSPLANGVLERLAQGRYSYCMLDPEGDFDALPGAVLLGTAERAPSTDEVLELLAKPLESALVNLAALPAHARAEFFLRLLPLLTALRERSGRPHWIVLARSEQLLPADTRPGFASRPRLLHSLMQITAHPARLAPHVLADAGIVIALGERRRELLTELGARLEQGEMRPQDPVVGADALVWQPGRSREPQALSVADSGRRAPPASVAGT